MSEQLQLRRGNSSQVAAFTGASGEVIVDTTNNRVVVQDGSTAGGWPAAKLDEVNLIGHEAINDTSYTGLVTDHLIAYTAITFPRTVFVPASSLYPAGGQFTVIDESGSCSGANSITLQLSGSDTINGSLTSIQVAAPYSSVTLENSATGKWTILAQRTNFGQQTLIADTSYVAGLSDRNIVLTSITAARVITLPLAASYPTGVTFSVTDASGNCSPTDTITITPNGTDDINGVNISVVMNSGYKKNELLNTVGGWVLQSTTVPNSQLSNVGRFIYHAKAVNINATGDTAFAVVLPSGFTRYRIAEVLLDGASVAPGGSARVGFYTGASQGGTAVAAQQAINGITSVAANTSPNALLLTLTNNATIAFSATTLYFNVGTGNGSALTVDVTVSLYLG